MTSWISIKTFVQILYGISGKHKSTYFCYFSFLTNRSNLNSKFLLSDQPFFILKRLLSIYTFSNSRIDISTMRSNKVDQAVLVLILIYYIYFPRIVTFTQNLCTFYLGVWSFVSAFLMLNYFVYNYTELVQINKYTSTFSNTLQRKSVLWTSFIMI